MWIIERLFVVCAVIFFLFFGLFLLLFSVDYFAILEVNQFILNYFHNWAAALAGILIILWALFSFVYSLTAGTREESISGQGPLGDVDISLSTIENIIQRTAKQIKGVREVKPRVKVKKEGLLLSVEVNILPDIHIPAMAQQLQENIKEQVEKMTGTVVEQVKVIVRDVQQELRPKGSRVS